MLVKLIASQNASKKTQQYDGMVGVVSSAANAGGWVKITIEDTGETVNWRNNSWRVIHDEDKSGSESEDSDSSIERFGERGTRAKLTHAIAAFFPDSRLLIGHLPGGSFNYVFTVTFRHSQFILRSPRHPKSFARFEDSVATLQYVHSQLSVDTPRVLRVSRDPKFPWVLMDRLTGRNMDWETYDRLPTEQACGVARQLASILTSIYSLTFTGCGSLVRGHDRLVAGKPVVTNPLEDDTYFTHVYDPKFSAPSTLRSFLVSRFELMAAAAESAIQKGEWNMQDLFLAVFCPYLKQATQQLNLPSRSKCVLFHPDLRPHNFLVQLPPKSNTPCRFQCNRPNCKFAHAPGDFVEPKISGLLDWDDCESLPIELAYRAPTWLWSTSTDDEKDASLCGISSFPFFLGQNPDIDARPGRELVRDTFCDEIERGLPGFMQIASISFSSGLSALGCVARLGFNGSSAAGLIRGVLRRPEFNLEALADQEFEQRRQQLLDKNKASEAALIQQLDMLSLEPNTQM